MLVCQVLARKDREVQEFNAGSPARAVGGDRAGRGEGPGAARSRGAERRGRWEVWESAGRAALVTGHEHHAGPKLSQNQTDEKMLSEGTVVLC